MKRNKNYGRIAYTAHIAIIGIFIVATILVLGTIWMGHSARDKSEEAVRTVSLLYLDELAGRREMVVENNLESCINNINISIELMENIDISDEKHLQAYQAKMKKIYNLEKFAFVDTEGTIYTSLGRQDNIGDYNFDYKSLTEPEISIMNQNIEDKKVIIAVPVDLQLEGKKLCACFAEQDMDVMLSGVSMENSKEDATFCNIYTADGMALSNTVLGGLAVEDNLLEAMQNAKFDKGYSYDKFIDEFQNEKRGVVSFTYGGNKETLSYVPVPGTNWQLTYLIRESVISQKIGSISSSIINRSVIQSLATVFVLLCLFALLFQQAKRNTALALEKETVEAENRVKQEQMQEKLELQERLLKEEKKRTQQDNMITAMASDYRSVYHVDLDKDEAVCYREDPDDKEQHKEGEHFPYYEAFKGYAEKVDENYRDGFLKFIDPENIKKSLEKENILAYRYLVRRAGQEYYEMIRVAGVRHAGYRDDNLVHAVGLGLTVIDTEMRENLAQQQVLSDALASAEQANKAKTAFLSNMSHEIRTPMNAIIGLDNIALNDPEISEKTRGYLEKIGSSADHLLNLINDILDMSRIESGKMTLKNEEFSFSKLLEAINTMFSGQCQEKGLEYQCHINGHVDSFYIGDDMKLRQVLINILGNAVKFTPAGGKIELGIEEKAKYNGKSTICFTISDTGIGMSEEFLPYIFDTFAQEDSSSTNKYGSSGLGLSITKSIVEMMNGQIEVESAKNEGTTFKVTVTLFDSERSSEDNDENVIVRDIHPDDMTVLIVDDDPIACEHAKLVLEKSGISSEIASSGEKAIEMVEIRHARREPYNLLLIDWKMPGMDGIETSRRIREIIGDESAIIILTAYRWDDVLEEALEAGVDSFLPKPLFSEAVIDEFKSALIKRERSMCSDEEKADLKGRRILLAEDMQVNAEIMVMVLEMREMDVELAENGLIAVEKYESHPSGYYDAILMDMRMPEMDGLEATRKIRASGKEDSKTIPIIALTANAFDEDVQRSLQAGLNAHLSKPVQPDALFETLECFIKD